MFASSDPVPEVSRLVAGEVQVQTRHYDVVDRMNCGVEYASETYRQSLATVVMLPSMSRRGNC